MYPPKYLKIALIYDFLFSIKLNTPCETVSTLERGIWGKLSLCSWTTITQMKVVVFMYVFMSAKSSVKYTPNN